MKTTIEIAPDLLAHGKRLAQDEQITLRTLVEEGLRKVIAEREHRPAFRLAKTAFTGGGRARCAHRRHLPGAWRAGIMDRRPRLHAFSRLEDSQSAGHRRHLNHKKQPIFCVLCAFCGKLFSRSAFLRVRHGETQFQILPRRPPSARRQGRWPDFDFAQNYDYRPILPPRCCRIFICVLGGWRQESESGSHAGVRHIFRFRLRVRFRFPILTPNT